MAFSGLGIFSLNAYVLHPSLTVDAWVVAGRHQHHRTRDHFGADSDLYVTIDAPIGKWGAGTPVKYVIQDLYERITALETATRVVRSFVLDAQALAPGTAVGSVPGNMLSVAWLDSVVQVSLSSSFTLRAMTGTGGSFTVNAYVLGYSAFYINAFVV